MLSGSLWQSATSIVAQTVAHAAQALENLDNEARNGLSDREDDTLSEVSRSDGINLYKELEVYKKLLEDAQMEQVKLCKEFRLEVSDKDAELEYLRKQVGKTDEQQSEHTPESNLLYIKVLSEKKALEESLQKSEEQLRQILREKNELSVMKKNYQELQDRLEIVKNDLVSLKVSSEDKSKQKNETIENLVSEYSHLAADAELQQQKSNDRILALLRENEVLVTKMHALEHSITELADRSSSMPVPVTVHDNSASSSPVPSTKSTSSPPTTPLKGEPSSEASLDGTELLQNQKELRAKIVNLEFDLREKEKRIKQYEESLKEKKNSNATALAETEEILSLKQSLESASVQQQVLEKEKEEMTKELALLRKEKEELLQEVGVLKAQLKQLSISVEENNTKDQAHQTIATQREEERQRFESQISQLEVALETRKKESVMLEEKISSLETQKQDQLNEKIAEIEELRNEKSRLQEKLDEFQNQILRQTSEIKSLLETKAKLEQELKEKGDELASVRAVTESDAEKSSQDITQMKERYEKELEELRTLNNQSINEQVASYSRKIEELERRCETLESEKVQAVEQLQATHQQQLQEMEEASHEEKNKLADSHNAVIDELKTASMREVEGLKESYSSQIQGLEKEIETLREQQKQLVSDHEQQLQDQLNAQKEKLSEQFHQKLEDDLRAQAEKLGGESQAQLEAMQSRLSQQHDQQISTLQTQYDQKLANEVQKVRDLSEAEKQRELNELREREEADKQKALSELGETLRAEKEKALAQLGSDKDKEKSDLERSLRQSFDDQMSAMKLQHEEVVKAVEKQVSDLQKELASIDSKHQAALQQLAEEKDKEKQVEVEKALALLRQEMQQLVDKANAERDEHLANYTKERKLRKKIHNKLLEIQGNIRVICRVRPILEVERRSGEDVDVTEIPNDEELVIQRDAQTKTKFEYDRVFGQTSTQEEVFEAVQPLCVSVLDGYNVCIFAYGQTGSGKTYTMEGYGANIGVSPRAIAELFSQIESGKETWTYNLSLSMLEIYNETIRDLLDSSQSKEKLDIRQTPEGNQVIGLTDVPITSTDQVRDLMKQGQANRAVGSHDMNEHSSRSHSILTVTCRGVNRVDGSTTFGKLHLIDLAGSERVSKTDATGERLKEAQSINKSLSCLGDVINALGNKKATHVPYRNSKLTFLLQDSLGGNSKVLTFVNISPAIYNLGETVCSLNFATRCRSTELGQAKRQTGASKESGDNDSVSSSVKSMKRGLTSSASMASLSSPPVRK